MLDELPASLNSVSQSLHHDTGQLCPVKTKKGNLNNAQKYALSLVVASIPALITFSVNRGWEV